MTGRRKTPAMRAAINARAAAWQRPLTLPQQCALECLGASTLVLDAGEWLLEDGLTRSGLAGRTLDVLERRGLLEYQRRAGLGRIYRARITRAGRRALALYLKARHG